MSATSRLAAGPPSSKSTFWPVVLMRFDCTGTRLPHPVLVDEHQRRDQLALRVEQVDLRGRRNHVGDDVADAGAQLVEQLDQPLAVTRHLFFSLAGSGRRTKRTRSSPSSIEAPAV